MSAVATAEIANALKSHDQDLARKARDKLREQSGRALLFGDELESKKGVAHE
jgi:hypothetical protein